MSEASSELSASELSTPNGAPVALLESLRMAGASRLDAVGWHYIEALAKRSGEHRGSALKTTGWRAESPKVQQFKKQLSQISVQKQVKQAMAQAPQNAGPINSHMLALRSLGLMRDASTDYLNRFMGYVDTLLRLEESGTGKPAPKKSAPAQKSPRK